MTPLVILGATLLYGSLPLSNSQDIDVISADAICTGESIAGISNAWQPVPNAISTSCNDVCQHDQSNARTSLCVYRDELKSCGWEDRKTCIEGKSCTYECVPVHGTSSWRIEWQERINDSPAVMIDTQKESGSSFITSGSIDDFESMQLPDDLNSFAVIGPMDGNSIHIGIGDGLISQFGSLEKLELVNVDLSGWKEMTDGSNLLKLRLVNTNMRQLLRNLPSELETLALNQNLLDEESLDLPNARSIELSNCNLHQVPTRIRRMTLLKELDISSNSLSTTEGSDFPLSLESLSISDAEISQLPDFSQLEKLEALSVAGNALSDLVADNLPPSIRKLNISRCYLNFSSWETLQDIEELDASHNWIGTSEILPPNLRLLDISSTDVSSLPKVVSKMDKLQDLRAHDNEITSLSEFNLPKSLEVLAITNNGLSELTPDMAKVRQLEVSFNPIASLSPIATSKTLEVLEASNCSIKTLPQLNNMPLTHLDVSRNAIKSLHAAFTEVASTLKFLNMSHNAFDKIPPEVFQLGNLSKLDLRNNPFTSAVRLTNNEADFLSSLNALYLNPQALDSSSCDKPRTLPFNYKVCIRSKSELGGDLIGPAMNDDDCGEDSSSTVYAAVAGTIGVIILVLVVVVFYKQRRRKRSQDTELLPEYDESGEWEESCYSDNTMKTLPPPVTLKTEQMEKLEAMWRDTECRQLVVPFETITMKGSPVAKGRTTSVYRGKYIGQRAAIKRLRSNVPNGSQRIRRFTHELHMLARLKHPCIISCIGIAYDPSNAVDMYSAMEWASKGDLRSLLNARAAPDTDRWSAYGFALQVAQDISEALAYLHRLDPPVIHGALTSQKVLITSSMRAKVTGFASARLETSPSFLSSEPSSAIPSLDDLPSLPLSANREGRALSSFWSTSGRESDVYALGVILYELDSHATLPQVSMRESSSFYQSVRMSSQCPMAIGDMVLRCLAPRIEDRPTAPEVHKTLQETARSLLEKETKESQRSVLSNFYDLPGA